MWHGQIVRQARAAIAAMLPAPCGLCGATVQPHHAWQVDHRIPLALGGEPYALDNIRPAHARCNSRAGARLGNRLRRERIDWGPSREW